MPDISKKYCSIILACGQGRRSNMKIAKQYCKINDMPIINYSTKAFIRAGFFAKIIIAIKPEDHDICAESLGELANSVQFIIGGETRQESAYKALLALKNIAPDYVFIHDAARPFISNQLLLNLKNSLNDKQLDGVIAGIEITDTIKEINHDNIIKQTFERSSLIAAQTPQAFCYKKILAAHEKAKNSNKIFTDDSSIAEYYNLQIKNIPGELNNIKITWENDFNIAEIIAQNLRR